MAIAGLAGLTACSTTTNSGKEPTPAQAPSIRSDQQLHGGTVGLDAKVWRATPQNTNDNVGLELQYLSPAGEMD